MTGEQEWESFKIGGGVPPIKTEQGWIFIYHGVDDQHVYRAGAALLDRQDPTRVVARIPYPLLEPEEEYERNGDIPNVVFPVGAYVHEGELYVYYGAADKYIALAKVKVADLLAEFARFPGGAR